MTWYSRHSKIGPLFPLAKTGVIGDGVNSSDCMCSCRWATFGGQEYFLSETDLARFLSRSSPSLYGQI